MAIRQVDGLGKDRQTHQDRMEFAKQVHSAWATMTGEVYFPFLLDEVQVLSVRLRKSMDTRIKVDIALHNGSDCFWLHRDKGPCSDQAEAGHLIPRCQGGELTVANGIIECRAHNNQRREMLVEQYLMSELRTS